MYLLKLFLQLLSIEAPPCQNSATSTLANVRKRLARTSYLGAGVAWNATPAVHSWTTLAAEKKNICYMVHVCV